MRWVAAALTTCVLAAAAPRAAAAQSWEDLETRQVIIAGIEIVVSDVFDLTQPGEDTWLGRTANALHLQTRRDVVRRELLFRVGDPVNARRIRETERNLRRYAFIRAVTISPSATSDRAVSARVEVVDAWSLRGSASLRREGGRTAWSTSVDEWNLFGRGKRLTAAHARTRERRSTGVSYTDPQVLGSRWVASVSYADLSDGASRVVLAERPFHSIETTYAVGGSYSSADYVLTQYHRAEAVYAMPVRAQSGGLFAARAFVTAGRTATRLGVRYDAEETAFALPASLAPTDVPAPQPSTRRLHGLSMTGSVVQDRPATFLNLASIGRAEDYQLGWSASARVGYFARSLGSTTPAPFGEVNLGKAWRMAGDGLLLAGAAIAGRHERGRWREAGARGQLTIYNRSLPWQTIATHLHAAAVTRVEPDGWLYLDSSTGLRGYPDRFLAGDRRVVLSIDDRIITDWRLLGLVQVGFVGYADVGAIRQFDTGRWSRTYASVGGGLRFGSLRGSRQNVLQASIATPLVRDPGMGRVFLVLGNNVRF